MFSESGTSELQKEQATFETSLKKLGLLLGVTSHYIFSCVSLDGVQAEADETVPVINLGDSVFLHWS